MGRGALTRVLLAATIAVAGFDAARAQVAPPPIIPPSIPPITVPPPVIIPPPVATPPTPPTFGPGSATGGRSGASHNDNVLYIVSAIVFAAVGWAIGTRIFGDSPPSAAPVF